MTTSLDSILQSCLAAHENGEPVEPILDRYPRYRAALHSWLAAAQQIQVLDRRPPLAAQQRSFQAFMAQARTLSRPQTSPSRARSWLRPIIALTTVLAAMIVLGVGAVRASEAALPGDPLYGLKRFYEDVQRALMVDGPSRLQLDQELARRRREEVRALQTTDREIVIEFDGVIDELRGQRWQIDRIDVALTSQTTLTGATPRPGAYAHVVGRLHGDGAVLALHIDVAPPAQPTAAPTSAIALATATPTPDNSPATAEPTATPRPTSTAAPQPTHAPKLHAINFDGRVEAMQGDTWLIAGRTVIVDGETDLRGAITVGSQVKVKAKQQADGTLHARRIELRDNKDKPQPTKAPPHEAPPRETPPPEQTPRPKPTQAEKLKFKGVVTSLEGDHWTIGDRLIRVDGGTSIRGDISIGTRVKGQAIRQPDGTWLAIRIERAD